MSIIDSTGGGNWSLNSLGLLLPVMTSCIGWFYPCTTGLAAGGTTSLTDYSPARQNATLAGAPTINAGYIAFGAPATGQFAQTSLKDPGTDFSIIMVARSLDTFTSSSTDPTYVSNYGADANPNVSGSKGVLLKYPSPSAGMLQGVDYYSNAGAGAITNANLAQTPAQFAAFKLYAYTIGTVGGVTTRTLYNLTDNPTPAIGGNTSARASNISTTFKFGGAALSPNGGLADMALVAFYGSCLSPTQLAQLVTPFVRINMASKGITV